jgi:AraC-like DNA-binding protein
MNDMQQPAPTTRFSVTDLPVGDRYPVWKESISVVFDVDWSPLEAANGFEAEVVVAHLGQILLARTTSLAQCFDRSVKRIDQDGLDHCLVQIYQQGGTRGLWGDRQHAVVREGDVLFLDAAQTVQSQVSDFSNLTLLIPRNLLASPLGAPERFHGCVLPRESATGRLLGEHLKLLWELVQATPTAGIQAIGLGVVDLIGRYFGEVSDSHRVEAQPFAMLALRETIRAHIEREIRNSSELDPEGLATRFGLSRSALYTLFKPFGGVARYVQNRRLVRAHTELLESSPQKRNITSTALRFGFKDVSHFSRAFRQKFGYNPSEIHEIAAFLPPGFQYDGVDQVNRAYEDWVRALGG